MNSLLRIVPVVLTLIALLAGGLAGPVEARGGRGGGRDVSGDEAALERLLRRGDQRLAEVRRTLQSRGELSPEAGARLDRIRRRLDDAWRAWRAGRSGEAMALLSAAQSDLRDLDVPVEEGGRGGSEVVLRHLAAADRLLSAMRESWPRSGSSLAPAEAASRRAHELVRQGRPGRAFSFIADERSQALSAWRRADRPPDRKVIDALIDADRLLLDDASSGEGSGRGRSRSGEIRKLLQSASADLEAGRLELAWERALDAAGMLGQAGAP